MRKKLPWFFSTEAGICALILLGADSLSAERPVQAWHHRLDSTPAYASDHDSVKAAAVDGSNDILVWGEIRPNGNYDCILLKYDLKGTALWTNVFQGVPNGDDRAVGLTVDRSNNIIVTCTSGGDWITMKYNSSGSKLWTASYGRGLDTAGPVQTDSNGDIVAAGSSSASYGNSDCVVIKYSSSGAPLWTNLYNGVSISALDVDCNGDIIVAGTFERDFLAMKYSSNGNLLWTRLHDGPSGRDSVRGAVAGPDGTVYLTGSTMRPGSQYYDFVTLAYSGAGQTLWTNYYDGLAALDDLPQSLTVDTNGNPIVFGSSDPGLSVAIKYSSHGEKLWTNFFNIADSLSSVVKVDSKNCVLLLGNKGIVKCSPEGVALWTNVFTNPILDDGTCLALDSNDCIIAAGATSYGYDRDLAIMRIVGVPVPVLKIARLPDNSVSLNITNLLNLGKLVVDYSSNLMEWAPAYTNDLIQETEIFWNGSHCSESNRYYRARQLP